MPQTTRQMQLELRAAWTRQLYYWWQDYNETYLHKALSKPLITIDMATHRLGSWDSHTRMISISDRHIETDPWLSVMDTLRHEMAHQYVDEVLKPEGEPPHGPAFRTACERLRCDPRATGEANRPPEAPEVREDLMMRKLTKVLALANSPQEHEAQVAMQKAQMLLLKYNLNILALDEERQFTTHTLGQIKARRSSHEFKLAAILNEFFFVEVLWHTNYDAKNDKEGSVLAIYGTPNNLDLAVYVYEYLVGLLPRMWDAYKQANGVANNRERMRYFAGVLSGFHRKLRAQQTTVSENHALVWKGDSQLKKYYRHMNPRITYSSTSGPAITRTYLDGVSEGRQVKIHKPVTAKGGRLRGLITAAAKNSRAHKTPIV